MSKAYSLLDNGMRVVTETVDHVQTVSLGVWLNRGSRHEKPADNGLFHFIEHTLFKGTGQRNARQIAETMDGLGGYLDAFTSKEETCFSFKVRAKHLDTALELLVDMLQAPRFDPDDLDRERQVILEEIKMEEDNPEDLAYERNLAAFWQGNGLGNPILGTPDNVRGFCPDYVARFHRGVYVPGNLLVSAAGAVDHEALCAKLAAAFPACSTDDSLLLPDNVPVPHGFQTYYSMRGFEQINFCMNFPGVGYGDSRRPALNLLSTLLGGGMSSRLFQKVREDRGLVYAIGSFVNAWRDCGALTIYGACGGESFETVMCLCLEELALLKREGVTVHELTRAKEQLEGHLVMGLESTSARASALARTMILRDALFDERKILAEIEAVRPEDVHALAHALLDDAAMGLTAIGALDGDAPATPWRLEGAA